jgi:hypothetical protein
LLVIAAAFPLRAVAVVRALGFVLAAGAVLVDDDRRRANVDDAL